MSVISVRVRCPCLRTLFAPLLTNSPILPLTISRHSLSFLHTLTELAAGRRKNCLVATCLGKGSVPTPLKRCPKFLRPHALRRPVFSGMCSGRVNRLVLSEVLRQACCTRTQRHGDLGRLRSPLNGQSFVGWQA